MTISVQEQAAAGEELAGRLFGEGVGSFHLMSVYLGVKLGLFSTLAEDDEPTAVELAAQAGLDAWYVREWLQAETIAGLVIADGDDLAAARFRLAPGVRETLVDETSPSYLGGLALAVAAAGGVLGSVAEAFHTGAGVPYSAYGPDALEAQASLNRPAYIHELATGWLPQVPGVVARLEDPSRPARVAEVGCGVGWAAIELAKAFPHVHVDGFDADEESISRARRHAAEHGVAEQVTFEVADAATGGYGDDAYDLVLFLECVHDLGRPVEALAAARAAISENGTVVVMDERTAETLEAPGGPTELFFATASVLWCLPQSRLEPDCQAPGTVMRPAVFEAIARRAGWTGVEILPIEHPFFRFYRLVA